MTFLKENGDAVCYSILAKPRKPLNYNWSSYRFWSKHYLPPQVYVKVDSAGYGTNCCSNLKLNKATEEFNSSYRVNNSIKYQYRIMVKELKKTDFLCIFLVVNTSKLEHTCKPICAIKIKWADLCLSEKKRLCMFS